MKSTLHKSKYFQITAIGNFNNHLIFEFIENKDRIDIMRLDKTMTDKQFKVITDFAIEITLDEMIADLITLKAKIK